MLMDLSNLRTIKTKLFITHYDETHISSGYRCNRPGSAQSQSGYVAYIERMVMKKSNVQSDYMGKSRKCQEVERDRLLALADKLYTYGSLFLVLFAAVLIIAAAVS
jgi:hypothetical protein